MVTLRTGRFETFGSQHFVLLGVFVVGCLVVGLLGRRLQQHPMAETRFRVGFAVLVLALCVGFQVLQWLPGEWDLGTSLPLQICDFAWIVAAAALLTRGPTPNALLYYWGLTLTVQAIVTPSLGQQFPDPRFFGFWARHLLTVWAAAYLAFGCRIGPTWHGYRLALGCTAVWAAAVMVFNAAAGTNYGYLNRKPVTASLLDVLGPWPLYVGVEVVVVAVVWALITWPWQRRAD